MSQQLKQQLLQEKSNVQSYLQDHLRRINDNYFKQETDKEQKLSKNFRDLKAELSTAQAVVQQVQNDALQERLQSQQQLADTRQQLADTQSSFQNAVNHLQCEVAQSQQYAADLKTTISAEYEEKFVAFVAKSPLACPTDLKGASLSQSTGIGASPGADPRPSGVTNLGFNSSINLSPPSSSTAAAPSFSFKDLFATSNAASSVGVGGPQGPQNVAPLIHTAKGVEHFDTSGKDDTLKQEELDSAFAKCKLKEAESLKLTAPSVGLINLTAWQYETISIVASASTNPHLAVKWMNQIMSAQSWEDLDDPDAFVGLGVKLGNAITFCRPICAATSMSCGSSVF